MSAYQPFQDPDGGKSTGAPPTPPVTNNFYGANANAWQGVNFNDQSAQISGYQSRYTYRGQPGNTSYGSPAASQADYQPGDDAYRPPPQGYGPTAQSSRHSYPEATQDYYPAAQALVTEGYSPPTDQDQYTGYPALASDATAQDSVVALTETQTSSSEYEWVHVSSSPKLPTVHIVMAPTWDGCIATRDSGTIENWISQDIVDRCRLQVRKGLLEEHTTFDGKTLSSCATVQPTWYLYGTQKSYKCEFRVVSDPPFDVLFGWNFLQAYPNLLSSKDAKPANPLLVLVQKKKESAEKRAIEERRKKAHEDSTDLQHNQKRGESSRSTGGSGEQRHGSSSKGNKKKESKKH